MHAHLYVQVLYIFVYYIFNTTSVRNNKNISTSLRKNHIELIFIRSQNNIGRWKWNTQFQFFSTKQQNIQFAYRYNNISPLSTNMDVFTPNYCLGNMDMNKITSIFSTSPQTSFQVSLNIFSNLYFSLPTFLHKQKANTIPKS